MPPAPGRVVDLVAWQRSALLRELAAAGLPLADDHEQGSCWRLAGTGVALSQRRYRPSPHLQFAHEWSRTPLVARALHLLAGGRIERADGAAFRRDHPDVAAALGVLRAALDGAGDDATARLAASPHPALASHLAWLRGEPLGDPLLDRWPSDTPWSPVLQRVAATPDALAPWLAAAREADARLAAWATLRAALAGTDGDDAARLVAEFAALAATLAGPTGEPDGPPPTATTPAMTREE